MPGLEPRAPDSQSMSLPLDHGVRQNLYNFWLVKFLLARENISNNIIYIWREKRREKRCEGQLQTNKTEHFQTKKKLFKKYADFENLN